MLSMVPNIVFAPNIHRTQNTDTGRKTQTQLIIGFGGGGGGRWRTCVPLSPFFSFSCSFQTFCQIIGSRPHLWGWRPRSGKYWIQINIYPTKLKLVWSAWGWTFVLNTRPHESATTMHTQLQYFNLILNETNILFLWHKWTNGTKQIILIGHPLIVYIKCCCSFSSSRLFLENSWMIRI